MNRAPGVIIQEQFEQPTRGLRTAVPLFLGYVRHKQTLAAGEDLPVIARLTQADRFDQIFEELAAGRSFLPAAVAGFFENGGQICFVAPLPNDGAPPADVLHDQLAASAGLDEPDLVCAPDIMTHLPDGDEIVIDMQHAVLEHCDSQSDRFAILDAVGIATSQLGTGSANMLATVLTQRQALNSANGALYHPWVRAAGSESYIPPCGHIAGIYARTDLRTGWHKAPANEILYGISDLQIALDDRKQGPLNEIGINCLRAFPGRGIRVWGARTLSDDPSWTYVNVRRTVIAVGRWVERELAGLVFEPNDPRLWARIRRELTVYLNGLLQRGALKGASPEEAFFVKCDEETNPAAVRDAGTVVTEIGLAPAQPGELVVIRVVHGAGGVTFSERI